MGVAANFKRLWPCLLIAACSGDGEPQRPCPQVAFVNGLERAELIFERGGVEAVMDFHFGPIEGSCFVENGQIVLDYRFALVADNRSSSSFDGLTIDYFVAVTMGDNIIDKTSIRSGTLDVGPLGTSTSIETIAQRIRADAGELPGDFEVLIGMDLPKDIGLRQRRQF